MTGPDEQATADGVSSNIVTTTEPVQGTEHGQPDHPHPSVHVDSSPDSPLEPVQLSPGSCRPAGENIPSPESACIVVNSTSPNTTDPAGIDVTNSGRAEHQNTQEKKTVDNEDAILAVDGRETGVVPLQEHGVEPVEAPSERSVSGSYAPRGRPLDVSFVAIGQPGREENETCAYTAEGKTQDLNEELDSGANEKLLEQPEDIHGSAADQGREQGSARDDSFTGEAAAEGEHGPDGDSEAEGEGGGTSGGSSVGSGGGSLTRLVERSSLEQQYRALLLLRRQLMARNQRVQQRLSQHFSRKTDDAAERVEKNVGELEARYTRYLSGIREQQWFTAEERDRRQRELAAFRAQVERQTELVAQAYRDTVELRRQVALKSRSSRTGRLMTAAEVETLIGREQQKELEVQEARLESLRRETRLGRLEQTLKESEELAGGIHLIDFEQLKIENQTYAEKIEERNEDLTKLRRKISSTVQIMTHLKERIQFEQAENERRQEKLQTVSAEVTRGRESLAQLKQRRDQVRSRTVSQRATAGLLGHEALLRDFEARVDEEARLARELHVLKMDYANNQQMSQAIRRTVRVRRQQQQQDRRGAGGRH